MLENVVDDTVRGGNRSDSLGADRLQGDITEHGAFHLPANHEIADPPVVTDEQIDHRAGHVAGEIAGRRSGER